MAGTPLRSLLFRQLFERVSSTFTYILACTTSKEGVIIDPVLEMVERDSKLDHTLNFAITTVCDVDDEFQLISDLGIKLMYALNTHVHDDHVTGTGQLKKCFPLMKTLLSVNAGAKCDSYIDHGDKVKFGRKTLEVRATPGHTNGCVTYVLHDDRMAFTGDALLIRGCGRTDFQNGNARLLYRSIHEQILSLPRDYVIYPAHDHSGRTSTSVEEEIGFNPLLTKSEDDFVDSMNNLHLPFPKYIDYTVPANLACGIFGLMDWKTRDAVERSLYFKKK